MAIPSVLGYVDEAKKAGIIQEAHGIYEAAQIAATKCYATDEDEFKKQSIFKIIKLSIHGRKDGLLSEKITHQLLFLSFELPEVAFPLRRNDFHLIEACTDHRLDRVADVNHFT